MQPDVGDAPVLHRAWGDAHNLVHHWRKHYQLPPNDPRFLEMTEEEILHDLLLIRYQDRIVQEYLFPSESRVEDLAASGAEQDDLVRRGKEFMATEATKKALRALLGDGKTDKELQRTARKLVLTFEGMVNQPANTDSPPETTD